VGSLVFRTSPKKQKVNEMSYCPSLSLKFAPVTREIVLDGLVLCVLVVSTFSVLALTTVDIFGDSNLAHLVYLAYYSTVNKIVPPIGSAFGVNEGLYMIQGLGCFAYLNRRAGLISDAIETFRIGTLFVVAFEAALHLVDPEWRNMFVVTAQIGTPLQWFTNDDLLACAIAAFVTFQVASMRIRKRI
jgi:hypothetical protein